MGRTTTAREAEEGSVKVYIVSTGSYSDWMILGIYTTPDKAEKAKADYGAENDVEEHDVDKFPQIPAGLRPYNVVMTCAGGLLQQPQQARPLYVDGWKDKWQPWSSLRSPETQAVIFNLWARDEEHAVKIANDRRAQLIATGEWTTDWREWMRRQRG